MFPGSGPVGPGQTGLDVDGFGVGDGVCQSNVLGRELHGDTVLAGSGPRGSPIVAVGKTALVGETGAFQSCSWNIREGGDGDIDVLGRARLA